MRIIAHAFYAYKWIILNSESFNKVYGKNKKKFIRPDVFCAFLKIPSVCGDDCLVVFMLHFYGILL